MSNRAHTLRLLGAFGAVYLIWGSTYLGMKVAVETIPPIPMGGMRFTAAGFVLLLMLASFGRVRREWLANWRFWRSALLTGSLMLLGANSLLAYALRDIPSGTGALVIAFTPVWLVIFDWIQSRSGAPRMRVIFGLILGAAGVGVLAGFGAVTGTPPRAETIGIGLATISTLCWALGSILGRRTPQPPDLLVSASMQMIAAGLFMALLSIVLAPWMPVAWSLTTARHWSALAYLTFVGSMVGFSSYVWLLQNTTAARASTYAYVNPLVAVLLGWLLLSEIPSARVTIATPLILSGVVLLQWRTRRAKAATVAVELPHASGRPDPRAPAPITPRSTSLPDDAR